MTNKKQTELREKLTDHINNSMPVEVDRDYAKYLIEKLLQEREEEMVRRVIPELIDIAYTIYKLKKMSE